MTKQEHIQYWIDSAERDWGACRSMFERGHFDYGLFIAYVVLEKLLKALWVKGHSRAIPLRILPLHRLAKETQLEFSKETMNYFRTLNRLAEEILYPDYKRPFHQKYTPEFAEQNLKRIQEIAAGLKQKLPS
jgi:HEPN domain-containing protein